MADTLSNRIKELGDVFVNMNTDNLTNDNGDKIPVVYVNVRFKKEWSVDESVKEKFPSVNYLYNDNEDQYLFCNRLENGFDMLFDAIEYNIEKMNEKDEKQNLIKDKINEFESIIYDDSMTIEMIRSIKISYKGKNKKNKEIEEVENVVA